ncbi:MAG: hypothetical protein A2Z03_05165 [Chloroflexi bacterium RBG_16_56_8]|nr:MAG: hypothetical protein A2Z03_05165 [Chloroflexi bacterium RBG_16_56_8]
MRDNDSSESHQFKQGLVLILAYHVPLIVVLTFVYLKIHGVTDLETLAKIDFIGGGSPIGVVIKVLYWSAIGALAKQAFSLGQSLNCGRFNFMQCLVTSLVNLLSVPIIAVAIIMFFRVTKLSIGSLQLTLEQADVKLIIILSILLGFFGEDARRYLGNIRERVMSAPAR